MAEAHEYIPASRARVKKEDEKYTVVLDGHRIEVSRPDFIEQNQVLSALYGVEKSKERRSEIAQRLYKLDLPLFKSWDIFGHEDRQDYEQDAFLWMIVALDSYDKQKGSFIYWLRQIVKRARAEYYNKKNLGSWYCKTCDRHLATKDASRYHVDNGHDVDLSSPEPLAEEEGSEGQVLEEDLAISKLRDSLSPENWEMVRMKILNGMKVEEIAASLKQDRKTVRHKIQTAVGALKAGMVAKSTGDVFLNDGSEWLTVKQFAVRMGFSISYVQRLIKPDLTRLHSKWVFDPRDWIPQGKYRIRFKLDRDGKLQYPRMIERKKQPLNSSDLGDTADA